MESTVNGYVTCQLGGEKRTLHFGTNSWLIAGEIMGKSIGEMMEMITFKKDGKDFKVKKINAEDAFTIVEFYRALFFGGFKSYALEQGSSIADFDSKYNLFQFQSWIDAMSEKEFADVLHVAASSDWLVKKMRGLRSPQSNHKEVTPS